MQEIADREGFLPGATWLLQHWPEDNRRPEMCGTIQGVAENGSLGAIQNVGIMPAHRGRGLGAIQNVGIMKGVPHHFSREYNGPPGPQVAQVAYPYYTTRGPRDYFANEPWSIGY